MGNVLPIISRNKDFQSILPFAFDGASDERSKVKKLGGAHPAGDFRPQNSGPLKISIVSHGGVEDVDQSITCNSSEVDLAEFDQTEGQLRRHGMLCCENECSQVTQYVFVGGHKVAEDLSLLREKKIRRIVNCSLAVTKNHFEDLAEFQYLSFNMLDGRMEDIGWFACEVIQFIVAGCAKEERTLVHCEKGISRSCSLVIAYKMWLSQLKFPQAFAYVKQRRPICSPNTAFTCNLLEWAELLFGASSTANIAFRCAFHSEHDSQTAVLKAWRDLKTRRLLSPSPAMLCSRGVLVLRVIIDDAHSLFLWCGREASQTTIETAQRLAHSLRGVLSAAPDLTIVQEGREPETFLRCLCAEESVEKSTDWFDDRPQATSERETESEPAALSNEVTPSLSGLTRDDSDASPFVLSTATSPVQLSERDSESERESESSERRELVPRLALLAHSPLLISPSLTQRDSQRSTCRDSYRDTHRNRDKDRESDKGTPLHFSLSFPLPKEHQQQQQQDISRSSSQRALPPLSLQSTRDTISLLSSPIATARETTRESAAKTKSLSLSRTSSFRQETETSPSHQTSEHVFYARSARVTEHLKEHCERGVELSGRAHPPIDRPLSLPIEDEAVTVLNGSVHQEDSNGSKNPSRKRVCPAYDAAASPLNSRPSSTEKKLFGSPRVVPLVSLPGSRPSSSRSSSNSVINAARLSSSNTTSKESLTVLPVLLTLPGQDRERDSQRSAPPSAKGLRRERSNESLLPLLTTTNTSRPSTPPSVSSMPLKLSKATQELLSYSPPSMRRCVDNHLSSTHSSSPVVVIAEKPKLFQAERAEDGEEFEWISMGVYDDEDLVDEGIYLLVCPNEPHHLWVGQQFDFSRAHISVDCSGSPSFPNLLSWASRVRQGEIPNNLCSMSLFRPEHLCVNISGTESEGFWEQFNRGY